MCQSSYSHYLLITILWLCHLISIWLPSDHTSLQFEHPIAQCDTVALLPHYELIIILPLFSHNRTATLTPCFNAAPKSLHKSPCHPTTFLYYHLAVATLELPPPFTVLETVAQLMRKNGKHCMMLMPVKSAHPEKWHAMHDVNACETGLRLYCGSVKTVVKLHVKLLVYDVSYTATQSPR